MRILFLAGREPAYVRNAMLLQCLEKNRVEVIDCCDSSASYPARFLKVLLKFLARRKEPFDCVLVGFLGQPLVPLVRALTAKPIVFDAFLSTYDTLCFDRKVLAPGSLAGRFFYHLDRYCCRLADSVILDTGAHAEYFHRTFGVPRHKLHRLLVGADQALFSPGPSRPEDGKFRVLYCSSYLPLHGTEYIVRAAARLVPHRDLEFVLVGRGRERHKVATLARELGADNVRFVDWLPFRELPLAIAQADLCLGGHFSEIEKAGRVIAGKTFQFIAMKKPVILGDGPGNRELFSDRRDCLMVPVADAEALAGAILELKRDAPLRERIAAQGYRIFQHCCNIDAVARELDAIVQRTLGANQIPGGRK